MRNMELIAELVLIWIPSALALYFLIHKLTTPSQHGKLPPGPRPFPIVGNLPLLGDKPHRSLAGLAKTHGPLMSVKLGSVTTIVASSPDTAREVLQTMDMSFCGRSVPDATRAHRVSEASVVWLPANQQWRSLRKICSTELFMSQRINNSQALRREKVRELVGYLKGRQGEAVDIGRAAFETVLNLISNTLFSIDMVDHGSESGGKFKDLVWALMEESGCPNVSDFFPLVASLDLQGRRRRAGGYLGKLREMFDELIEKRMQQKTSKTTNDFLDSLIRSDVCGDDPKMHRHAMKSLLGDLFVAGTDTSSHTLEWAMAELLRNPSLMVKAQAELLETIGHEKEFDESDIHRLPYLQAVVKETLRVHPPTPLLLPRRTEATVELLGYTIPEGTRVLVNVWAIGRDPDVWTQPELFLPDRFLESQMDFKGRDFEFLPFGSGRRICPGMPLAFRMVHLMLASLLQSFNWRLPDGMETVDLDMEEKFGLTLAKAIPLHAVPLPNTS